ncbi:hypothetical protein [Rheinheimera baltica]|nr:hypothetical protein [Rheinheimera baltica]MDP5190027.1 hypothetical protein [Rheinheimera baltica]
MSLYSNWLLLIYLSPVLSISPVMLLWQTMSPMATLWHKWRV